MSSDLPNARWSFRQSPLGGLTRLERRQVLELSSADAARQGFDLIPGLPTEAHCELLTLGRIPDPHLNEDAVQWVGEEAWLWRCDFDTVPQRDEERAELVFDGLDTFVTVWLDAEPILDSSNAFLCDQRVDVTALLRRPGPHVLLVQIVSAALRARQLFHASDFKATVWNGEPGRAYVRKPQYVWGWVRRRRRFRHPSGWTVG